uniref:Uncharacterized protein n=1 Tax=Avena sativa TaxID=4498 RepID=A0ACD5W5S3_AVESA
MNMAMRGNNVKTSAVILVAVCLVALVQTQQVHADHCCCPGSALIPAYITCRAFGSVSTCCRYCTGRMTNQDGCPYPYIQPPFLSKGVSETNYGNKVVDYCKMGCTASVCNKIITSVASSNDGGKDAMERCTSACHDLCTKDNAKIAKAHGA